MKNLWISCVQQIYRPKFIPFRELWRSVQKSVLMGVNGLTWLQRSLYIVGWIQECPISASGSRTTYPGARLKNAVSRRPVQEWPISAPCPKTTYLGVRLKNDLSRRPVEKPPISAPDSRTTYLKRDFCFSDFVVTALRDFKIRLL